MKGTVPPLGPSRLGSISGRMVPLVERAVRLNMGEIGKMIVFSILLSRKWNFSNNFFMLVIFVADVSILHVMMC
jgi:hypothetical protein